MFILRRITSESNEINTVIGSDYNLIYKDRNPQEFKKTAAVLKFDENDETIYGFIVYSDGSKIMPLYIKSHYFMMCSDGKTFANYSMKNF